MVLKIGEKLCKRTRDSLGRIQESQMPVRLEEEKLKGGEDVKKKFSKWNTVDSHLSGGHGGWQVPDKRKQTGSQANGTPQPLVLPVA